MSLVFDSLFEISNLIVYYEDSAAFISASSLLTVECNMSGRHNCLNPTTIVLWELFLTAQGRVAGLNVNEAYRYLCF